MRKGTKGEKEGRTPRGQGKKRGGKETACRRDILAERSNNRADKAPKEKRRKAKETGKRAKEAGRKMA